MRDFTVSEVLDYSRNIEKESYNFYNEVSITFSDAELKKLATGLAEEELKHYNRINTLLEKASLTAEEMNKKVQIKREDYDSLVASKEIPENPAPLSILEAAYQRELRTESVYRSLLSFTDLADDIIDTFSELVAQEKGHASRISAMMKKYQ